MPFKADDKLLEALMSGEYGEYMKSPKSFKERLEIIGTNLANLRSACQISQKQVCKALGCTPQTYSGYEQGKHEPSIEVLVRLAYLFGVSTDFLLSRDNLLHDDNYEEQGDFEKFVENIGENPKINTISHTVDVLSGRIAELEKKMAEMQRASSIKRVHD